MKRKSNGGNFDQKALHTYVEISQFIYTKKLRQNKGMKVKGGDFQGGERGRQKSDRREGIRESNKRDQSTLQSCMEI